MALFKINRGQAANLPTSKHDGYAYFTTDDGKFYIDYENDQKVLRRQAINAEKADMDSLGNNINETYVMADIGDADPGMDYTPDDIVNADTLGGYAVSEFLLKENAAAELGLFANVKDYGAVGDGSADDSAAFQLALNSNQCVYAPPGDYVIGTTLAIWQNHSRFYCEGKLIVRDNAAVSITANSNDVYIRKIDPMNDYSGEGVRVGSNSVSTYYNTIEIGTTGKLNKGIVLAPDGQGVAYTTVRFKEIIANYGIVFEPTTKSGSFINENTFIGGAISGSIPVYTVKNGATDPFNGNKFQNIGLEWCSSGMVLNWFQNNHFIGCRFAKQENSWNTFVTLDADSYGNIFNYTGFVYVDQISQAQHNGTGNIFDGKLLYNTGSGDIELGRRGIMQNMGMVIPDDDKYDYYTHLTGSSSYDYGSQPYAIEGHTYVIEVHSNQVDEVVFTIPNAYWYGHALFFDLHISSAFETVNVIIRHPQGWLATITTPGLYRFECNASRGWVSYKIDGTSSWLTGTTEEITPKQVYQALVKEQSVRITYRNSPYGHLTFTSFGAVGGLNSVVATEVLSLNGEMGQCQLVGNIPNNIWLFEINPISGDTQILILAQEEFDALTEQDIKDLYESGIRTILVNNGDGETNEITIDADSLGGTAAAVYQDFMTRKTRTVTVNSSFVNSGSITAESIGGVLKVGGYLQTKAQHSSGGATTIICTIPGVKVSGNTYAVMIDHDHSAKAYNILLFTNESGNTVVQIEGSSTSIAASTWLNFSILGILA